MTTRARWTALEELTLRAGFQDGLPLATIAGQLGRTPTAVREKRKRLGLRRCDRHTLSAAAVAQMHGRGLSQDGDELGWPRLAAAHRRTAGASLALRLPPRCGIWSRCRRRSSPWTPERHHRWRAARLRRRAAGAAPALAAADGGRAALSRHVRHGGRLGGAGALCAPSDLQRYGGLWMREDALHGFVAAVRAALGTHGVLPATRADWPRHATNGGPDLSRRAGRTCACCPAATCCASCRRVTPAHRAAAASTVDRERRAA